MKPSILRRIRRRTASHEAGNAKKENAQEQSFFGEASAEHFFQPAAVVQRKCAECEKEEKVLRTTDKKEDEKLHKKEDKKEDEKLMKKEEKKEDLSSVPSELEEEKLQKKEAAGPSISQGTVCGYVSSISSKGSPLPAHANQFFSSRMGYDFSNVRVHTEKEAATSAKEINANAYTIGNHIVFNEEQYNTESGDGKKLMAHELTHVMQNNKTPHCKRINRSAAFKNSTPAYSVNLAEQFITAISGTPGDTEFGSTHPLINNVDLTATSSNPIKTPALGDITTVSVKNQFESSVTTVPVNETSFRMRLPQRGSNWRKSIAVGTMQGVFGSRSCNNANTTVVVTGDPNSATVITNTKTHEDVHVRHISSAHTNNIVAYDNFISTTKATDTTEAASKEKLLRIIQGRAAAALSGFASDFTTNATQFHSTGGPNGTMSITSTGTGANCMYIRVKAKS